MLRVAVPNKGALSEPATEILAEAGYRRRTDSKDLTVIDPVNNVEFFFLRPKDIAIYVGSGELDFGITGRDLVCDSGAQVRERLALGFRVVQLPLCRSRRAELDDCRPSRDADRHRLPESGPERSGHQGNRSNGHQT